MMKNKTSKWIFMQLLVLLLGVLILISSVLSAEIYKWLDETGGIHFSDAPPEGPLDTAKKLDLDQRAPNDQTFQGTFSTGNHIHFPETFQGNQSKEKVLWNYEIPFEKNEEGKQKIRVSASFGKDIKGILALDTTSSKSIISIELAEQLGHFNKNDSRLMELAEADNDPVPETVRVLEFMELNGLRETYVPVVVRSSLSESVDGVIGYQFFSRYDVNIDSKKKTITFKERKPPAVSPWGRDEEWWKFTFDMLASSRDQWKGYLKGLDDQIILGFLFIHPRMEILKQLKAFSDRELKAAQQRLEDLDRIASQHSVSRKWRAD